MITSNQIITVFGQELSITYNTTQCINELVLDSDKTIQIIDPNLKSTEYSNKKVLYFFQKQDHTFSYFYFDVNQIFFLGDNYLFIPDFVASKFDSLRLLLKEPLISNKTHSIFLDPFLTTRCYVVDCSKLADVYILLKVLSECKNELVTFKNGRKIVENNTLLPAYGKVLLEQADLAFKDLLASKKETSETYHRSLENWLTAKEKSQAYVGKIHPKFKEFYSFQRDCIKLCANSLKSTSIFLGMLFDLFMGAGKTIISCVWMDFLRDYHDSQVEFIIITPKNVIDQWDDILVNFNLQHLSSVFSWDSWKHINDLLKSGKRYFVIADESHYCYGPSIRNEEFYKLLNQDQILGSVQLSGTPYSGKPGQIVWVARSLGHYWGKYPAFFQKQLETVENCSQLVKDNLQDCVYSLTLDQALILYPDFKIPKKDDQLILLDMADPLFNNSDKGIPYLEKYEQTLINLAIQLQLESIADIPQAMQKRGSNMIISHKILQCLEELKTDWIAKHSDLPLRMKLGKKIVFFTKYRHSAEQLYKLLSPLNDLFHLKQGNYTLKKRNGLSIVKLQHQIGELESHNSKSSSVEKQIKHLKSEIDKLRFTKSILSKSSEVLERLKPGDLDLIKSEEMMIDHYHKALIIGGVNSNTRRLSMEAFNSHTSEVKYIVCSVDAGGTGLNLQESNCDEVYHLGIGTNYRTYQQSLSRVRRCGNESDKVQMSLISFEESNSDRLNLEASLIKLYNIKHTIVENIKSEELEQTALYNMTESEILSRASQNMGFNDYLIQSADSKLAEYRSKTK